MAASRAIRDLLDALATDTAVRDAAIRLLAPLNGYDRLHGGDLTHTLGVYFACNGNASKTAASLFLHRNGLLYRLSRIEEILRISLDDPQVRLALNVALQSAGATRAD